jgi:hypothetical protein
MGNKLTIIKVLGKNGKVTQEDLEKWRYLFATGEMNAEEAAATGEVTVEVLPEKKEDEHYITLVRIGDEDFSPSFEDLEKWREVFEEAQKDPDFKIFTHPAVEIEVIPIGKVIAVE